MSENLKASELGAYTNNLPNNWGMKKLVKALNDINQNKQDKLTAGDNIAISDANVISATDTKYTAGDNIAISEQNVISATDTKYTAGTGISISEQNVISANIPGSWTERTANNDWTDIFGIDDNKVYAKKDIIIAKINMNDVFMYLPKGYTQASGYSAIRLEYASINIFSSSIGFSTIVNIKTTSLDSSVLNISTNTNLIEVDFDNKSFSTTSMTGSTSKSSFRIFTRE